MSDGTILQYARHHGLATDHQASLFTFEFETLLQYDSIISNQDDTIYLRDIQEDLARCVSGISDTLTEPRFKLTIKESNLLSSAIAKPIFDIPFSGPSWQSHLPNHRFRYELKLREPLLFINSGDLYKDLQGVKKGIDLGLVLQDVRDQWKVDIGGEYKRMTSDNESFIHELLDANDLFDKEMKFEKTQVSKEALRLLGEAIDCEDMQESLPILYFGQLICERRKSLVKLPIMLSAHDFVMNGEHSVGDTETSRIEILADLSDLELRSDSSIHEIDLLGAVAEAMETEDQFTRDEEYDQGWIDAAIQVPSPKMEEKYMNTSIDSRTMTSEPARKRRKIAHDFKLLAPLSISSSPKEERITTDGSGLEDFGIASDIGKLLNVEKYESDNFISTQGTVNSFDQETIELSDGAAAQVDKMLVSESVSSVFALTKVEVPDLPPPCPGADTYDMSSKDLISEFLDRRVETITCDQKQEIALNWIPFAIPSLWEITEESFHDTSGYLSKAIAQPEKIARSDQLLWKADGLRILRNDELDEEELELDSESEDCISVNNKIREDDQETNMRALRQTPSTKTPQNPHIPSQALGSANELSENLTADKRPLPQDLAAASMGRPPSNAKLPDEGMIGFSTSNSLSSFLNLRGRKFVKPRNVVDHIARESSEDPIQLTQGSASLTVRNWAQGVTDLLKEPSDRNDPPPPTSSPQLSLSLATALDGPRTIVVSNTLLQTHPNLIKYLERQGGSDLTIIYRDLDPKHEKCPDLILNPKTAVMYANTQLLAQRPLPGQDRSDEVSPVHCSTSKLAAGFDNVIVILMHKSSLADNFSSTDSILVSKYVAFCDLLSASDSQVRVLWLKYSNTKFLANLINTWTWSCITQYSLSSTTLIGDSQLMVNHDSFIQDETLWELFLRRAGMNALGAQFVLGALKKSESHLRNHSGCSKGEEIVQSWGLSCFVTMKPEDRLRLFSDVLGRRTISIMNGLIDCHV